MGNTQWVTITTEEIVGTYVYRLKPWVDPYSLTRVRTSGGRSVSTGRRAPETTKGPALRAEAYQEYYLVKLPDSTYVLAQFGGVFAGKIKKEEKITLPIGQRRTVPDKARQYLTDICQEYGADMTYMLYMVDDAWGEEKDFTLFLLRFGAAAGVFFLLSVGLVLTLNKKGKIFLTKIRQLSIIIPILYLYSNTIK